MAFEMGISLSFGKNYENCTTLSAQLINGNGTNYSTPYTTGFVNLTNGYFLFTPTIPASFRGAIKFYCGVEFLGVLAINPEEYENIDVKVSTRCSSTGIGVPALTNPIPINPEKKPMIPPTITPCQGFTCFIVSDSLPKTLSIFRMAKTNKTANIFL